MKLTRKFYSRYNEATKHMAAVLNISHSYSRTGPCGRAGVSNHGSIAHYYGGHMTRWTTTYPTAPGFYWFRGIKGTANGGGFNDPEIVEIRAGDRPIVLYMGTEDMDWACGDYECIEGEFWPVPLSPPVV